MPCPKDLQAKAQSMPGGGIKPGPNQIAYLAHMAQVAMAYDQASRNLAYSDHNRDAYAAIASQILAWGAELAHLDAPGWNDKQFQAGNFRT